MAVTPSTMLALGTPAPDFSLPEVATGATVSLGDFQDRKALLVIFLCRHCPFVLHVREELARLGRDYPASEVAMVAIGSNDAQRYPQDSPEGLKAAKKEWGLGFPVLHDATQEVAMAYSAACTPDFFLFGPDRRLVYRGQLDDSRPSNSKPVNGASLREALDAVLAGREVSADQWPSVGCNIKWKPGNEPDWFV